MGLQSVLGIGSRLSSSCRSWPVDDALMTHWFGKSQAMKADRPIAQIIDIHRQGMVRAGKDWEASFPQLIAMGRDGQGMA